MEHKQSSVQPPREMSPGRLEAFSDGVLAVIITIMVLELRHQVATIAPHCRS